VGPEILNLQNGLAHYWRALGSLPVFRIEPKPEPVSHEVRGQTGKENA
jgi:hypothetical protein